MNEQMKTLKQEGNGFINNSPNDDQCFRTCGESIGHILYCIVQQLIYKQTKQQKKIKLILVA